LEIIFQLRKNKIKKLLIFDHLLYFRFFVKQCADIFGSKFDDKLLERGINFTNAYYGAERYSGTRVLFVNGAIDPWHALSFIQNPPNNNSAIFLKSMLNCFIPGFFFAMEISVLFLATAHCADMYPDAEWDPEELRQARQTISDTIGKWLQ
jgi:hypothetical protein